MTSIKQVTHIELSETILENYINQLLCDELYSIIYNCFDNFFNETA